MIIVAIYSLLSTLAIVLDLLHHDWVAAFCVAVLSAAAFTGGGELRSSINSSGLFNKFGSLLYAAFLLAVSLWLSHYRVNLLYYVMPGLYWSLIGIVLGFLSPVTVRPQVRRRR